MKKALKGFDPFISVSLSKFYWNCVLFPTEIAAKGQDRISPVLMSIILLSRDQIWFSPMVTLNYRPTKHGGSVGLVSCRNPPLKMEHTGEATWHVSIRWSNNFEFLLRPMVCRLEGTWS